MDLIFFLYNTFYCLLCLYIIKQLIHIPICFHFKLWSINLLKWKQYYFIFFFNKFDFLWPKVFQNVAIHIKFFTNFINFRINFVHSITSYCNSSFGSFLFRNSINFMIKSVKIKPMNCHSHSHIY
jgi:hypothetical protein